MNTQPRDYMLAASIGLGIAWALVQWWSIRTARHAADARLIAAAPELLQALQLLHDDIAEYAFINNLGGFDNHCMRLARAAIAKATGAAA